MLTALHIEKKQHKNKVVGLLSKLLPDKINVEIKSADGIKLKCITYLGRREKVNFSKIDRLIGAQRNRLLCAEDSKITTAQGYKRFSDNVFKKRLCTNLCLELLRLCKKEKLKVGFVDIDCELSFFTKYLLKYCDSLSVVTYDVKYYSDFCEELMYETGVSVRVSKKFSSLSDCDIVIAPEYMDFSVNLKDSAVVLCTRKPDITPVYTVVYDYTATLPKELSSLKTDFLSDTYIMSALYTMKMMYDLGSIVPSLCVCENSVHTLESLKNSVLKACKNLT